MIYDESMDEIASKAECHFCRQNKLLKGDPLAETDQAYLIESLFGARHYLIVPSSHIEEVTDLPDDWWQHVKQLVTQIPDLGSNYNISLNYGKEAGQTQPHLHFWVIPREAGKPSSGKGFARLIHESDQ